MPSFNLYGSGFVLKIKGLSGRLTATHPSPTTGAAWACLLFDYVNKNTVPGELNLKRYKDIIADETYTIGIVPEAIGFIMENVDVTIFLDGALIYSVKAVKHFDYYTD